MTYDGTHTYQYDAEGRVASVDGGSMWTFVYNALGERAGALSQRQRSHWPAVRQFSRAVLP